MGPCLRRATGISARGPHQRKREAYTPGIATASIATASRLAAGKAQ